MGFHLPTFADNFLRCADGSRAPRWTGRRAPPPLDGHTCRVGAFPISIDVEQFRDAARAPDAEEQMQRLRERYAPGAASHRHRHRPARLLEGAAGEVQGAGVPLGAVPGVPERFTFIQVAVPSRSDIEAYDELAQKVDRQVWEINERFGTDDWKPIHLIKQSLPGAAGGALPDGGRVHRQLAAGRDEPGGQGVRRQPGGPPGGAPPLPLHRRRGGDGGRHAVNPYDPRTSRCASATRSRCRWTSGRAGCTGLQGSLRTIYDWMDALFRAWGEVPTKDV
jgi:hypothetical protein